MDDSGSCAKSTFLKFRFTFFQDYAKIIVANTLSLRLLDNEQKTKEKTMATKLAKLTYPENASADDFQCFGPPATKDGEFDSVKICDMGCFTQDGKDSNKYVHSAIVQHKNSKNWYVYNEWGRTGATKAQFQFIQCRSENEAQQEFAKYLHSKNDKRGEWVNHSTLGRILQAKKGKDCYLVRPQATRSTGLPDARTIKFNEGSNGQVVKKKVVKKKGIKADSHTIKLMRDLNVGTITYTKGSMANDSIPTQVAIDEARDILTVASKRVSVVGDNVDDQLKDSELNNLTSMIYGRIPKKKDRNAPPETWLLSKNTILGWTQDLDAYESALYSSGQIEEVEDDPFGGMKISMEWVSPQSKVGEFIYKWMPNASRNVHSYLRNLKILNVWKVDREGDDKRFHSTLEKISNEKWQTKEKALHQEKRIDIERDLLKKYIGANTAMLFHGSRSVNVSGLLRESFRMPKDLVNVVITGAMFSGGGGGIYFADDWRKSAGYTSLRSSYYAAGGGSINNRGAFMFICDVALGNPFVAPRAHPYLGPPKGHHCVFGKAGKSGVQNNEFIIFDKYQQNMRYLVEFET